MGTIHFVSDLESSALKALKDAEDCADIVNDLGRIYYYCPRRRTGIYTSRYSNSTVFKVCCFFEEPSNDSCAK